MVWVWPPHTSMILYRRPGSASAAIFAASAWAFSASRNSSTNLIVTTLPSLDLRFGQRGELVGIGLVDLRQREADVDEHPVAGLRRGIREQPDVDHPPDPADVHLGQVGLFRQELDDLTGNA